MANVFINAKSVKVFLGTVIEAMPYLRASKSYFKDQIVGKKCGRTYSFYLPDSGTPTDGLTITADDRKTIVEKSIDLTVKNKKSVVALDILSKVVDMENFMETVSEPYARTLGVQIQKDVISDNLFKAGSVTVSSDGWSGMAGIAAQIRATRQGAKITGYLDPLVTAKLASNALNNFKFSDSGPIATKIYAENAVGKFGGAEWVEINDLPEVIVPSTGIADLSVNSAVVIASETYLNIVGKAASIGTLPAGYVFTLPTCYSCDLIGNKTKSKFGFIVQEDTVLSGATAVNVPVQNLITENIGSRNCYIGNGLNSAANLEAVSGNVNYILSAGVTYLPCEVRTDACLAYDDVPMEDLAGAKTETAKVGEIQMKVTTDGDFDTMVNSSRWDLAYLAGKTDIRESGLTYVPLI